MPNVFKDVKEALRSKTHKVKYQNSSLLDGLSELSHWSIKNTGVKEKKPKISEIWSLSKKRPNVYLDGLSELSH